jgi:hypothetical protein
MAAKVADLQIQPTESGVKIPLKALYVYPDGHMNLVGPSANVVIEDEIAFMQTMGDLLRRAKRQARKSAVTP